MTIFIERALDLFYRFKRKPKVLEKDGNYVKAFPDGSVYFRGTVANTQLQFKVGPDIFNVRAAHTTGEFDENGQPIIDKVEQVVGLTPGGKYEAHMHKE